MTEVITVNYCQTNQCAGKNNDKKSKLHVFHKIKNIYDFVLGSFVKRISISTCMQR